MYPWKTYKEGEFSRRAYSMGSELSYELVSDHNGATVHFRRKPEVSLEDVAKALVEHDLPENTRFFEQKDGEFEEIESLLSSKEI